ncbi:DEAD/DEAH box helicase [Chthonobacter rhizosphaerae]|uniref:DEAD/DEAH box helicase n=1 Tax=Chthonobacter rhizosphaerae TaxID=2735553 RepID=UPI0015EFCB38|nr:DEAD/DEAH box helicase [Chthonobacter rhizosphaerae]
MTSFSDLGLSELLLKALEDEGYTTPTPIQAQAIPELLKGRDLLGIAQTGTGKTAAFALPILNHLAKGRLAQPRRVRCLVLSPTRELATQIADSFKSYGRYIPNISVATVFGGVGHRPQEDRLRRGVDVLIATPGRLMDHLESGAVSLDQTEVFVLDEADQMLDMGFVHSVRKIVRGLKKERQSLFFSATMPKEIGQLAGDLLTNPATVTVAPVATTAERVAQKIIHIETAAKRTLLRDVIVEEKPDRVLVFTRTKHGADRVVRSLEQDGIAAVAIHGNKSQAQREKALAGFKSGATPILVATDIAARGIDVDGVSHVINFDLPNIPESYVHRIGRTARAGASGIAISFCDQEERAYLKDIEKLTRQKIPAEDRRGTVEVRHMPRAETDRDERAAQGARGPHRGRDDARGSGRPGGSRPGQSQQRRGGKPSGGEHGHHTHARDGRPQDRQGDRTGKPAGQPRPQHRDTGAAEASLGRVGFLAQPSRPRDAGGQPRGDGRRGRG